MLPRRVALAGLAALLAAGAPAPGSELDFDRVETESGPSHNSIFAITQDRQGFLWIGTQDGLDRFDGERFEVFRNDPADRGSLSANRVNCVLEDRAGRLWVGTAAGIDRFDRRRRRFVRYALDAEGGRPLPVLEIVESEAGQLWAGTTAGLYRWREAEGRWIPEVEELAGLAIRRVRPDGQGGLWLLVDRELLRLRDGRVVARIEIAPERAGLDVDAEGVPWLDAARPRARDGSPRDPEPGLPDASIQVVLAEPSGEVWTGTHRGLRHRSADGLELGEGPVDVSGSLANFVVAIFRDATGRLWLGTENGLYRHDPFAKRFRHAGAAPGREETPHVSALAEDERSEVWVGTFGAGILRLVDVPGAGAVLEAAGWRLPDPAVWALIPFESGLLAAGEGWLCRLERTGWTVVCADGIERLLRVGALASDSAGDLWLADLSRLRRRGPRGWLSVSFPPEPGVFGSREPTQLLPDGDRIWLATFGGALKRFEPRSGRFDLISRLGRDGREQTSPVFDLHRDREGKIWLGTGDGLSRFAPEEGSFDHFGPGDGLPGSNVYSILEDEHGRLWLGTNRGLARFDPSAPTGAAIRTYGVSAGVVNVEFNRHARLRTSDGRFLFGGLSGVTIFRTEEIRDNPIPPRVALTRIDVLGRDGSRRLEPYRLERLVLDPQDSALSIEFAALDFSSAPGGRFAYQLEGLDPEWVEADSVRQARYAGLAPGSYVFRVRAANGDGLWSVSPASLAIEVRPPFWATWWFRGLAAVSAALLLAFLYRRRVRHLIELERMRLRIAGDLHDELGSDLSGIALATSRLGDREELAAEDRKRLADVQEAALRVLRGLRDIVWYVDPEHDSLASTALRMRSVAADLLPDAELRFIERLGGDPSAGLDMSIRRHVFLVFKELAHNVARHAGAESVEIEFAVDDGELRLTVADDGGGFDPTAKSDGSGLASLRRRARQIGGRLEVESAPGAGTRARLVAPMTRTRQGGDRSSASRLRRRGGRE